MKDVCREHEFLSARLALVAYLLLNMLLAGSGKPIFGALNLCSQGLRPDSVPVRKADTASQAGQNGGPSRSFSLADGHSEAEWSREIRNRMLHQEFHRALALCLEAQHQYPQQALFRDYEASIREFLQAEQHRMSEASAGFRDEEQLTGDYRDQRQRVSLRERLVTSAKQDPLLAIAVGMGLHQGSTLGGMTVLNPFLQGKMNLYFSPSLGLNIFYYGLHWDLPFEHSAGSKVQHSLYSVAYGGSLRFRNKLLQGLFNRSFLSLAIDIGAGLYDVFALSPQGYTTHLIMVLGMSLSDRPFYHFGGIEALAGLQIDLNASLFLNTEDNAPNILQTGNIEVILWQSFGVLRFGLSYRASISEYYRDEQVFFLQNQFAFVAGLEWRTSFQ